MGRRRASFDAFFEESHARLVSGLVLMTGDREVAAEAVAEGTYQLVVRNPDHLTGTFTVPGLAGRQHIAPNQSELTFTMTITARSDRKWGIEPTDQGYRNNGEGVLLWIE